MEISAARPSTDISTQIKPELKTGNARESARDQAKEANQIPTAQSQRAESEGSSFKVEA